jgi:glycosyltransferase involved in cell wall biosynthesis
MVILESLAAGTPVVVMPSCHISETLRKINSSFVALDESASGVAGALRIQLSRLRNNPDWYETKRVSFPYFGQEAVTERLIEIYESQLDT